MENGTGCFDQSAASFNGLAKTAYKSLNFSELCKIPFKIT